MSSCEYNRLHRNIIYAGVLLAQSWQRNADVLNLSKLIFQHLLKLQEPSVSFNLASLSQ